MTYPNIALHFGHLIPMYKRMFPTRNKASALYSNVLNNEVVIYFSVNAKIAIAEKLIATTVKYTFFCLFIISLGIIMPCLFSLIYIRCPGETTSAQDVAGRAVRFSLWLNRNFRLFLMYRNGKDTARPDATGHGGP